jgi:hypothetical protein
LAAGASQAALRGAARRVGGTRLVALGAAAELGWALFGSP